MTVVVGVDGAGRKLVETTTQVGAEFVVLVCRSGASMLPGTCCAGRSARSLSFRKVEVTCSKGAVDTGRRST